MYWTAGNCTANNYVALGLDVGRQRLFYTAIAGRMGRLGKLSTDGKGHRVLLGIANSKPGAVVIDSVNRFTLLTVCLTKLF